MMELGQLSLRLKGQIIRFYINLDEGKSIDDLKSEIEEKLASLPSISNIEFKHQWVEVYVNEDISDAEIIAALKPIKVLKID